MFGLIAGSFVSKLVIAAALSGVAMFAVGSVIDRLGEGQALKRELAIRSAITEEDTRAMDELNTAITVHRKVLGKANTKINDLEDEIETKKLALPSIPEDTTEIKQCPKVCRF